MDIIIANKRKEEILKSDLGLREHKCATGVFSVESILTTISKLDFEYLIIEEEALENVYETDTWIKLTDKVDANKIYVLLNTQTMQTNQILLGTIINLGIYNFDTTPSKLLNLIRKPNALSDVSRFREMIIFKNRQTRTEYDNTLLVDEEETNRRVQEYAAKNIETPEVLLNGISCKFTDCGDTANSLIDAGFKFKSSDVEAFDTDDMYSTSVISATGLGGHTLMLYHDYDYTESVVRMKGFDISIKLDYEIK